MNFNDMLRGSGINPEQVLVMRHRPHEAKLSKVLPWLAAEKPHLFNAYQQTQAEKLQNVMESMTGVGHVASFIGHTPGRAMFVGLYGIGRAKPLTGEEDRKVPACIELKAFGMEGFTAKEERSSVLWFDLTLTDFYASWKGKLIILWPGKEISWWRRAHKNDMPVQAVLEHSALDVVTLPDWDQMSFTWDELRVLPTRWGFALEQWRSVYYIFDTSDGKGYVGSAYGAGNLLQRWLNYAASGHGGNHLLRKRNPKHFHFTILQRVSPDLDADEVIRIENSWKERLHTRQPHGLNDN